MIRSCKKTAFLLVILLVSGLNAQMPFQAGGHLAVAIPQNEFRENVDNLGLGGNGQFAYNIPNSPVLVGGSISFIIYGSETREEPFSTTIPDVYVDVTTTNSILMGHLFLRIQPPVGFFRPYLDGLFGFSYLSTETSIKDQDDYDEAIASSTNFDDATFNYGGGGGLMFRVFSSDQSSSGERPFAVYADVGFRYLRGGTAEYLKEGSIRRENGKVIYDISESTTDLVILHFGVSFSF